MNKSLIERVQMLEKPLSITEKRIMDILISQPDAALFESVNSIAVMANTHGSSLVRLARKLGFSGFPEMRQYLRNDVSSPHRTEDLIRARLNQSETSDILTELVESEIESLKSVQQFVNQEQLNTAADSILAADRIIIFAEGTAEALARHAEHRLRRAGQLTLQLSANPRAVAEGVTLIGQGDLVLGFALREPPRLLTALFSLAKQRKAKTLLISDLSGLMIKPAPDLLLAASRGRDAQSNTLTIPMALLNALILTVAYRGGPDTIASYELYTNTRDALL